MVNFIIYNASLASTIISKLLFILIRKRGFNNHIFWLLHSFHICICGLPILIGLVYTDIQEDQSEHNLITEDLESSSRCSSVLGYH